MSPATLFSDLMAGVTGEGRIGDGRRPHFQRWLVAWSLGGARHPVQLCPRGQGLSFLLLSPA